MCDACRLNLDGPDIRKRIRDLIDKCGWAVLGVEHAIAPYAYTVGLTEKGLPELVVEGLGPTTAQSWLNELAHRQVVAGAFEVGQVTQVEQVRVRIDAQFDLRELKAVTELYGKWKRKPTARKLVLLPG